MRVTRTRGLAGVQEGAFPLPGCWEPPGAVLRNRPRPELEQCWAVVCYPGRQPPAWPAWWRAPVPGGSVPQPAPLTQRSPSCGVLGSAGPRDTQTRLCYKSPATSAQGSAGKSRADSGVILQGELHYRPGVRGAASGPCLPGPRMPLSTPHQPRYPRELRGMPTDSLRSTEWSTH